MGKSKGMGFTFQNPGNTFYRPNRKGKEKKLALDWVMSHENIIIKCQSCGQDSRIMMPWDGRRVEREREVLILTGRSRDGTWTK
jgi:hypothetical protein